MLRPCRHTYARVRQHDADGPFSCALRVSLMRPAKPLINQLAKSSLFFIGKETLQTLGSRTAGSALLGPWRSWSKAPFSLKNTSKTAFFDENLERKPIFSAKPRAKTQFLSKNSSENVIFEQKLERKRNFWTLFGSPEAP